MSGLRGNDFKIQETEHEKEKGPNTRIQEYTARMRNETTDESQASGG
jgi:hypothetical protein